MKVANLFLIRTGQYNDPVIRPYMAYGSHDTTAQLMEQTKGGRRLEITNMAGVAGQIIRPVTEHAGRVDIVGGWNHTRMRFLLEIHHDSLTGDVQVQYLSGYTDYDGVSNDLRTVDPQLRMYINNSVTTRKQRIATGYGMSTQLAVQDASQILLGTPTTDYRNLGQSMHTLRPEDVFGTIGAQHDQRAQQAGFYDLRSPFTGSGMKKSLRANGSPTSYLSKTLKAYQSTLSGADVATDYSDLANVMAGAVQEPTITTDPFIGNMIRFGGSLSEGNSFTFAELCRMCAETDHNTTIIGHTQMERQQLHQVGQSEQWTGQTHEALIATMISHSIPAIMCDLMLTAAQFSITNRLPGGMPKFIPGGYDSFTKMDLTQQMMAFEQRAVAELFRDITRNNEIDMEIWCKIDLLGESDVTIAYMGNPPVRFVAASFADALNSPIVAYDLNNVVGMATDIDAIANQLSMEYAPNNQQQGGGYSGPVI